MARKGLVAQTTRKAPAVSMRESFIAPTLLPVCCLCRKIRDESGPSPDCELWVTQRRYQQSHGINPGNFPLTHTYCPTCFTQAQNILRE